MPLSTQTTCATVPKGVPKDVVEIIEALCFGYTNKMSDGNTTTLNTAITEHIKENMEGEDKTTEAYKIQKNAIVIHGILSGLNDVNELVQRMLWFLMTRRIAVEFLLSLMGAHMNLDAMMERLDDDKETLDDQSYLKLCNIYKMLYKYSKMITMH